MRRILVVSLLVIASMTMSFVRRNVYSSEARWQEVSNMAEKETRA